MTNKFGHNKNNLSDIITFISKNWELCLNISLIFRDDCDVYRSFINKSPFVMLDDTSEIPLFSKDQSESYFHSNYAVIICTFFKLLFAGIYSQYIYL